MLDRLGEEEPKSRSTFADSMNRLQTEYLLPKRESMILVSEFSVELRAKIIDCGQELEAHVAVPQLSSLASQNRGERQGIQEQRALLG